MARLPERESVIDLTGDFTVVSTAAIAVTIDREVVGQYMQTRADRETGQDLRRVAEAENGIRPLVRLSNTG